MCIRDSSGSEVHRLVAGGSTATHPRVPRARSFDENRDLPIDLRREAFQGVRRLKLLQATQPRGRLLRVNLPLHLRGTGPEPGREAERERGVEPDLSHDSEGLPKIVLRLPRETDDEVGGERHARADLPQRFDLREILPASVAPPHGLENTVGAGLQRKVDVRAKGFYLLEEPDRPVIQVPRVGGDEPDPRYPLDRGNPPKQFRERDLPFLLPVGVDVLSQQDDFHHTTSGESADLGEDILGRAAYLPSPNQEGAAGN